MNNIWYEHYRDNESFYRIGITDAEEHFHMALEVQYCFEGTFHALIDDKNYIIEPGQLLLIPPLQVHTLSSDKGNRVLSVVFPTEYSDIFLKFLGDNILESPLYQRGAGIDQIAQLLYGVLNANELTKKGIYFFTLGRLIELGRLLPKKEKNMSDFALRALSYIQKNYMRNITLNDAANALGYSRCYFSSMFNKRFHSSFSSYLNSVRISHSLPLLNETSISAAYETVGFNSAQSYYKNFKRIMGCTPNEYKCSQKRT